MANGDVEGAAYEDYDYIESDFTSQKAKLEQKIANVELRQQELQNYIADLDSNITYLFIIADILLLAFMGLEIFLIVRKTKKEKLAASTEIEDTEDKVEIKKEWDTTKEVEKENAN